MPSNPTIAVAITLIALAAPSTPRNQIMSEDGKAASTDDRIGTSVAIDGKFLISGTPGEAFFDGADAGYVNAYRQIGPAWQWVLEGLISPNLAAGDQFGTSVGISGKYAIVGAPGDDDQGDSAGAAYVFVRGSNGVWTVDQKLSDFAAEDEDEFGSAVAIDGKYAVVGAAFADGGGTDAGRICFFIRNRDGWDFLNDTATIDGLQAGDLLGACVAIDGKYAVVGLPGNDPGAAWVYRRDGSEWIREDIFTAFDDNVSGFGTSVAISGKFLIVGAPQTLVSGAAAGKAYVFARQGNGQWEQVGILQGSAAAAGDNFGAGVAISGSIAVVGASLDNTTSGTDSGSYSVFRRNSDGTWSIAVGPITPDDGEDDAEFGAAVALDGKNLAVGAPGHAASTGRTYVFR